ncbi:MAG: hypothetical protein JO180_06050 [Gemmatirosa sp.]|nr:hypothetical protein [Gemmatirosa sp.]
MQRCASGLALLSSAAMPARAAAQARPYVFTVTAPAADAGWLATVEASYTERAFEPVGGEGLGPALALRAPVARRATLFARAGTAVDGGRARTSAEGELLFTVRAPGPQRTWVALGAGAQREYSSTGVLTARLAAGREMTRSRLDANVLVERPLARDRDAVDLVTTAGWMHAVGRVAHLGVEAVGQDLEGFWEPDEAEGGARVYAGPSGALTLGAWQLAFTAGPVVRSTRSDRASTAPRPLGQSDRNGVALRTAVSYVW